MRFAISVLAFAALIPLAAAQSLAGEGTPVSGTSEPEPEPTLPPAPPLEPPRTPIFHPTPSPSPDPDGAGAVSHAHFGAFPDEMPADVEFYGGGGSVLGIPATREASGTAWQPDTSQMYGWHRSIGRWNLMLHGTLWGGYIRQGDPDSELDRGGASFFGLNHAMLMARREVAGAEFGLRTMLSAEPFTVEDRGYPLLLQSGETFEGKPIHDRQHPHDLFMELAAMFTAPLSDSVGLQLYVAPAGEPALGPVAFPHRVSAQSNPLSTLSHHWQDSSHITFGVATMGFFTRHVKVEGSAFNGREPDEDRLDLDYPGVDSWSARVSVMPLPELVLQASYGYMRSPEILHPEDPLSRFTASLLYARSIGAKGSLAFAAIAGRNEAHGDSTDGLTLEGEITGDGRSTFFFRGENVRKSGHDLALPEEVAHETWNITQLTLGYLLELGPWVGLRPSVGALANTTFLDAPLAPYYGDEGSPRGFMLFLRLRPGGLHDAHATHPTRPSPATEEETHEHHH